MARWKSSFTLISVEIKYINISVELSHNGWAANKMVSSAKEIVLYWRVNEMTTENVFLKRKKKKNKNNSITVFYVENISQMEFWSYLDERDKPGWIFLYFFMEENLCFWSYYSSLLDGVQNHVCAIPSKRNCFSSVILV